LRRPGLLFLAAALACGTTSGQRAGQRFRPAADTIGVIEDPMLACVDAVVANSGLFHDATKGRSTARSREYGLGLRSPPGAGLLFTARSSRDGAKSFLVEGRWQGAFGGYLLRV